MKGGRSIYFLTTAAVCLIFYMTYAFYVQNCSIQPNQQNHQMNSMNAVPTKEPKGILTKGSYTRPPSDPDNGVSRGCPYPEVRKFSHPLTNFEIYPCLPGLEPSQQLKRNDSCVRTVNFPSDMLKDTSGCEVLHVRSGRGTPICMHSSVIDRLTIRAHLSKGIATYEGRHINKMIEILKSTPDMVFFDAGCNIGVYTLAAALCSNRVVSVDANYENLFVLSKSLTFGNLWDNVTLIWNALSREHETVILHKVDIHNVGAAELDPKVKERRQCDIAVNAIVLDDLKDLFVNKKVYMKLDIQGQEPNTLSTGVELFRTADVRYVQLEYILLRGKPAGRGLIDTMTQYGFAPYVDCGGSNLLDPSEEARWPPDACFIKNSFMP